MPDSLTPADAMSANHELAAQASGAEPSSDATPDVATPISRKEMLARWPKTRTAALLNSRRRTPDRFLEVRGTASCVKQRVTLRTGASVYLNTMLMPAMQSTAILLTRSIGFLLSKGFSHAHQVMDVLEDKLATLTKSIEHETSRLMALKETYSVDLDSVEAHNQDQSTVEWYTPLGRQFILALMKADDLFRLIDALHMYSILKFEKANELTNTYIRLFSRFNKALSDYSGRAYLALERMKSGADDKALAKIFNLAIATAQDAAAEADASAEAEPALTDAQV